MFFIASRRLLLAAIISIFSQASLAGPNHSMSADIGKPGEGSPSRTIRIVMYDNYYDVEKVDIQPGETVRFSVVNEGQLVHEFNIGTEAMHLAHAPEMLMMVEHGVLKPDSIDQAAAEAMQKSMGHGKHDDPNSVLLEPGKTGELVWTFDGQSPEQIQFACNVPGHLDAGMVGSFVMAQ